MKHLFLLLHGAWALYVILSITLSVVLLLLLASLRRTARLRRAVFEHKHRSESRLLLLRSLLELCYAYAGSPEVFQDKFKDRVNFCQTKTWGLFDEGNKRLGRLKEDERLLCQLLEEGFTQRELCVVFNLKKASYIYVKYRRILQKLDGTDPHA